jgi:hypothetical protein
MPRTICEMISEETSARVVISPATTARLVVTRVLFRLWGSLKRGSVYPPDSQVLLELCQAALQFGRCDEAEVIGLLRTCWDARPVKALLPFLLGAVEMLDRLGSDG